MKMQEITNEGYYDTDPKLVPFIEAGQKIMSGLEPSSGVKWPDDEEWNMAAKLGQQLVSLGHPFGAKSLGEALKKAGVEVDQAKAIIAKTKDLKIGLGAKDPEPEEVDEVAGPEKCWPGHKKVGTQKGTGKNAGKRVNKCKKI